ncbi:hypothetical protein [uncultured Mitsuokella sp.]|uniref:hypothetical protein n=1 Tax=uncultured Mitsuokella sp. TaxID=453120 RepID=UPI0025F406A2|nr:hypothetical protein [uncultured Mitsuokella sp.]
MEKTNIIKKYEKVLMACPLLAGIPTNQYEDALTFLQAKVVHLAKARNSAAARCTVPLCRHRALRQHRRLLHQRE